MDYHRKHQAYTKLKGAEHLEKDQQLLEKLNSSSKALKNLQNPDRGKVQQEVLWDLLDVASEEDILKNRGIKKEAPAILDPFKSSSPEEILGKLDLDKDPDYYFMKELAERLRIKTENRKKATLILALRKAREVPVNEGANSPKDPHPENSEQEASEVESGEGEKNQDGEAAEGAGIPDDSVGSPGGPEHPEGSDPV